MTSLWKDISTDKTYFARRARKLIADTVHLTDEVSSSPVTTGARFHCFVE
jgi:hypothetical protein